MQILVFILFLSFCVASFIIPHSVMFGESLCFAYTYAMVQIIEVAMFEGNFIGTCILLVFALILPLSQILKGIQNQYMMEIDNIYGELYMGKEILLYWYVTSTSRRRIHFDKRSRDNMVSSIICTWILLEIVFSCQGISTSYKTIGEKFLYIARFAPAFSMVVVNM
jgi:hypothetical protein